MNGEMNEMIEHHKSLEYYDEVCGCGHRRLYHGDSSHVGDGHCTQCDKCMDFAPFNPADRGLIIL